MPAFCLFRYDSLLHWEFYCFSFIWLCSIFFLFSTYGLRRGRLVKKWFDTLDTQTLAQNPRCSAEKENRFNETFWASCSLASKGISFTTLLMVFLVNLTASYVYAGWTWLLCLCYALNSVNTFRHFLPRTFVHILNFSLNASVYS